MKRLEKTFIQLGNVMYYLKKLTNGYGNLMPKFVK